jgi:hypothetical protein
MEHEPRIQTAIPKKRYQIGPFVGVVLGDIDSSDGIEYRYVLAMVEEGVGKPGLFICAERNRGEAAKRGRYRMRVVAPWGAEVLGDSDRWGDLDNFVADSFSIAMAKLALTDETPVPLM